MASAQKEEKKGDIRVYLISGFLLSCIVAGGVFLALYITLPETQSSSWYPVAGMVLVAIPWVFWLSTFIYSCFSMRPPGPDNNQPNRPAKATTTTTTTNDTTTTSTDSPGGAHVRFGATTVMGEEDSCNDSADSITNTQPVPTKWEGEGKGEAELYVDTTSSSIASNNDQNSFSHGSHESEAPLAQTMLS